MSTNEEIAYQEALDYLYTFIDYSLTRAFRYTADKFDLNRMERLLELIGSPHQKYPIIHVAGTKGKGSVSALCASSLRAAGYQVGLYTSPHLQDYSERIQINGVNIPHGEMAALVEELKPAINQVERLTTFEITTALGFLYFARHQVDIAVIEVGLGGRLDATNVVSPLVSVITSLSMDHMAVLGNTLEAIAAEKGGIIKAGKPVVLAPQREEARKVIQNIAEERGSRLYQVGREFLYAPWAHSLDGQTILVWPAEDQPQVNDYIESGGYIQGWEPVRLNIPLLGYHQVENAGTAYAVLQIARQNGIRIGEDAIRNGFASVVWHGRFEVLRRTPPVIIDSAHNRDSALKLRLALEDYIPGQPVILVFGASEDKDLDGMFTELLPRVRRVIATQSVHPRAMETGKMVDLAHKFGCRAEAVVPLEKALDRALELAGNEAAVVVTGSLFVAAAARETWLAAQENIHAPTSLQGD